MENVPSWVATAVGIASIFQIVASFVLIILGVVLIWLVINFGKQLVAIVTETRQMVEDDIHKQMMPEITGTLKNVRGISDDARATSKNVTTSVNNVAHVVTGVTSRLESPVVRAVGVLTGLAAGARALKGREATTVEVKKKKRGLFGR